MRTALVMTLLAAACGSRSGAPSTPVPQQADGMCPAGTEMFSSGCGPATENAVAFVDGCYVSCAGDGRCLSGTTCETVWIDPCAEGASCDACGSEHRICLADR